MPYKFLKRNKSAICRTANTVSKKNIDLKGTVGQVLKISDLLNDDTFYSKANNGFATAFTNYNPIPDTTPGRQ